MTKKRIGNDIQFTWRIYRKDGETQTPETFEGKEVTVQLLSPLRRAVEIEDVTVAEGVVTFTFRGKCQAVLGEYVAVLYENRGGDDMVTLDVVRAVTLVPHSYMEQVTDCKSETAGDVIEASSVELVSDISTGSSGGGSVDAYTKAETDALLENYVKHTEEGEELDGTTGTITIKGTGINIMSRKNGEEGYTQVSGRRINLYNNGTEPEHTDGGSVTIGWHDAIAPPHLPAHPARTTIHHDRLGDVIWETDYAEKIPAATRGGAGLMSAEDKEKLDGMSGGGSASDITYDNSKSGIEATNVQEALDAMVDSNQYEAVVLTVGSKDSAFSPIGQTVTVTLADGSSTMYTVPLSRQITFRVQRGMTYTISATSTDDYRCLPLSVKAAIATRYLDMYYIPIATGVFILQKDGNYYLRGEYDAETMAEDAVGVLVLTSALINAGFGIVLKKGQKAVSGKLYPTVLSSTINDLASFEGQEVTSDFIAKYGVSGLPGLCVALSINTDIGDLQGYIGAYAEYNILNDNTFELNECLKIIETSLWSNTLDYVTISRTAYGTCVTVSKGAKEGGISTTLPLFLYSL